MRTLTPLIVLILAVTVVSAEETLTELQNTLIYKQSLVVSAQNRVRAAETALKSNNDALGRTKSPDELKLLRTYIAASQAAVTKERSDMQVIIRDVADINQRIAVIQKAAAAPALQSGPIAKETVVAAAPAKAPVPQPLKAALLKDGTRIEYIRCMEVDGDYVLQLADKKMKNVKKQDIGEIEAQ